MSSNFSKNMAIMEERFPKNALKIRSASLSGERRVVKDAGRYEVFQARTDDSRWLCLNSAYDPVSEAERQTSRLDMTGIKLIFMLGEGGFYHVESILRKVSAESRVLFFSTDPGYLRLVLEHRDLTVLIADERFFLVLDQNWDALKAWATQVVYADAYDIPTFTWFVHPVEDLLQQDFVLDFQGFLHRIYTTSLVNVNTTQFFEEWWLHNFICNIPYRLNSIMIDKLGGSWAGKPVIVVGAGPSLNKNIDLLPEIKEKALILCVDTAFRILEEKGIEPDMLVTLDGSPMNAEHLKGRNYKKIPLLMDSYSHRDIVKHHGLHTPRVIMSSNGFHEVWWKNILGKDEASHSLECGGSVATAAVSFARYVGADPVILIGVDLSYPGGASYAKGALHGDKNIDELRKGRQMFPVTDIYGQTVLTTFDYQYYLRWLHQKAKEKDRRYINATEGGAVREGFEIKTLAEVLQDDCVNDCGVEEWLQGLKPRQVEPEERQMVFSNLRRSYRELKAAAKYLQGLVHTANEYLQALTEKDFARMDGSQRRLNQIQLRLQKLPLALAFLDAHSYKAVYTDVKLVESIERNEEEHAGEEKANLVMRQSRNLFLSLKDLADKSLHMHRDAIKVFADLTEKEMTGYEHFEPLQASQC